MKDENKIPLSEYLKGLFEKNSNVFIIPVRMNKKIASSAYMLLNNMKKHLDIIIDVPDEEAYNDYQTAILWMTNQILKRYSKSDLCI